MLNVDGEINGAELEKPNEDLFLEGAEDRYRNVDFRAWPLGTTLQKLVQHTCGLYDEFFCMIPNKKTANWGNKVSGLINGGSLERFIPEQHRRHPLAKAMLARAETLAIQLNQLQTGRARQREMGKVYTEFTVLKNCMNIVGALIDGEKGFNKEVGEHLKKREWWKMVMCQSETSYQEVYRVMGTMYNEGYFKGEVLPWIQRNKVAMRKGERVIQGGGFLWPYNNTEIEKPAVLGCKWAFVHYVCREEGIAVPETDSYDEVILSEAMFDKHWDGFLENNPVMDSGENVIFVGREMGEQAVRQKDQEVSVLQEALELKEGSPLDVALKSWYKMRPSHLHQPIVRIEWKRSVRGRYMLFFSTTADVIHGGLTVMARINNGKLEVENTFVQAEVSGEKKSMCF